LGLQALWWKQFKNPYFCKELASLHRQILYEEVTDEIHFEKSRSPYQWKKFNDNMQFDDIEKGPIWNFIKKEK
jgi:hypothetical protein